MKIFHPIYEVFAPILGKSLIASGSGNTAPNQPLYKGGFGSPTPTQYDYGKVTPGVDDGGDCNAIDGNDIEFITIKDVVGADNAVTLQKPRRKFTMVNLPN